MKTSFKLPIKKITVLSLFSVFNILLLAQSNAIESALSGVVTVAVFDLADEDAAFGFGDEDEAARVAYETALDMTGVASSGSGFLIKIKGKPYVITNAHVVNAAESRRGAIGAFSIGRKKYPLRLVGGDSFYDLAVLAFDEVEPGKELTFLEFANASPSLAENVYAIGNPLGLYPYSITDGIVSGKNRLFQNPTTGKYGFMQHTATLIWGNSGGPLVNKNGQVVGVNTWIGTRSKATQQYIFSQLNFAIEIEVAQRVINDIIDNKGRVRRTFLGLEFATRLDFSQIASQPFINGVLKDSPASGIAEDKLGWTVISVNEKPVKTLQDVLRILEETGPNSEVAIAIQEPAEDKPRPRKEVLTLKSGELSESSLESISRHFFDTYTDYSWSKTKGATLKSKAENKKPKIEIIAAGAEQATFTAKPGKPAYDLVGAGLLDDWGRGSLYRIRDARDMGRIIRLCSLEGHISAAVQGGSGDAEHVRFFIQDEDFYELRVLFY